MMTRIINDDDQETLKAAAPGVLLATSSTRSLAIRATLKSQTVTP